MSDLKKFEEAIPFLIRWLYEYADVPVIYRLTKEVIGLLEIDENVKTLREELEDYKPAKEILLAQLEDGSWGGNFRGVVIRKPSRVNQYNSLEYQFSKIIEFGFNLKHKQVQKTANLLFLYITGDRRAPLFEAKHYLPRSQSAVKWYMKLMTIISAKLLSIAGYQNDERLRKWLISYISQLNEYLESEKSAKPYSKFKGKYIIDEEIMMPGYHLIDILAFNRWLCDSILGKLFVPKIFNYLKNFPPPPPDCPISKYESINYEFPDLYIRAGDYLYRGLGIPVPITIDQLETTYKNRIPSVIKNLELRARIGILDRHDPVLEWLLSHQDNLGIIRFSENLCKMIGRDTYHYFPLQENMDGEGIHVDTTFRTILIAHYIRTIPRVKL